MRNTLKIALFFVIILAVMLLIPSISNAAEITINEGDDLVEKVLSAEDNSTIILNTDVEISRVMDIVGKTLTIDGNNHTISGDIDAIKATGLPNQTLIAASTGSTITLKDVTLTSSPKYGAQAYNGGKLILDGVNIHDCTFGGVLNNGGVVEIIDLTLGYNGESSNNGIEIGKGSSLAGTDVVPVLIMNGTLKSDQKENVIYVAENDEITSFEVQNELATTSDRLYIDGNKIIVADKDNFVKFESNSSDRVTAENTKGEEYIPNPVVTISVPGKDSISFEITLGTVLSEEELASKIDLTDTNYKLDGFFIDENYETAFDFRGEIDGNVTIYAKLAEATVETPDEEEPTETPDEEKPTDETPVDEEKPVEETPADETSEEKDETPKTGVSTYIGVAAAIAVISLATVVVIKKKNS